MAHTMSMSSPLSSLLKLMSSPDGNRLRASALPRSAVFRYSMVQSNWFSQRAHRASLLAARSGVPFFGPNSAVSGLIMICHQYERASVKVLVELLQAIYDGQRFLVYLTVVSFCSSESPGHVGNWTLASIRIAMNQDCSNSNVGRVTSQYQSLFGSKCTRT